jgi:hypothetical protein
MRASIFTAVLLVMALWFIILRQDYNEVADVINFLPMEYTPLVVWIAFFGYLCIPIKKIFNYPGRRYILTLLKEVAFSLFTPITFRVKKTFKIYEVRYIGQSTNLQALSSHIKISSILFATTHPLPTEKSQNVWIQNEPPSLL